MRDIRMEIICRKDINETIGRFLFFFIYNIQTYQILALLRLYSNSFIYLIAFTETINGKSKYKAYFNVFNNLFNNYNRKSFQASQDNSMLY